LKTVVVARDGNQSVTDHLAEMRGWLAERNIVAQDLAMLHVLNFRVVFRGTFERDGDADQFTAQFG
jgi:hypothetical protein